MKMVRAVLVGDTGPILNFVYAERVDVLEGLFDEILIPGEVRRELESYGVRLISIRGMREVELSRDGWGSDLSGLQAGEAAAIQLAGERELRLLMDEKAGRRVAEGRGISVIGTLGVLRLAKGEGLIEACGPVLGEMRRATGAWMGEELVRRFLEGVGESS